MSKQIDAYSFALGVCEAFCEVVRAGVKRIALSALIYSARSGCRRIRLKGQPGLRPRRTSCFYKNATA